MSKFLIAGGGIAGLSVAVALARAGHEITILEQAAELSEVGAGLQLGPNATRILRNLDLQDAILERGYEPPELIVRDARDDSVLVSRRLDDARERYSAPYVTIRRADLQSVLLQAAQTAGIAILTGQAVTSFEQNESGVAFESFEADALLGCDGVRSNVREQMLKGAKHGGAPRVSGHTAYRALIDMALLPMNMRQMSVQIWLGKGFHVVAYPVNAKQLNVVLVQEGEPAIMFFEALYLQTLIAAIQAHGGFTEWPLFDRRPMLSPKYYTQGRVALAGDAAHPMRPYLAQGAAMAIEDADALAKAVNTQSTIKAAMRSYALLRYKRNAWVQLRSQFNGYVFHSSGVTRLARNAVLRVLGERMTAMPWLYDYQNHSS